MSRDGHSAPRAADRATPIIGVLPLITEAERLTGERLNERRARRRRRAMWPVVLGAFLAGFAAGAVLL